MDKVIIKINKKITVGALSLFALLSASSNAQSLEEAVAQALDSHPDIQPVFC